LGDALHEVTPLEESGEGFVANSPHGDIFIEMNDLSAVTQDDTATLREEIAALRRQAEGLRALLPALRAEATALREENAWQKRWIKELREAVAALTGQDAELRKAVATLTRRPDAA
jgi:chromosome segregation ATPase